MMSAGRRNVTHVCSWLFSMRNNLKLFGVRDADDLRRAFFSVARRSASRKVGLLERGDYFVNFDWRASYP